MGKANGTTARAQGKAARGKHAAKVARAGGFAFVRPADAEGFDPLEGVMDMGSRLSTTALTVAIVAALVLHAGAAAAAGTAMMYGDIFAWANNVRLTVSAKLSLYEVEVAKEPDPPPPEPPKEEVKEEPKPEVAPPKDAPKDEPPPPPAAAQAGAVMTQEPAKDEPVDLTGNTFVTGSGSTYAGGTTSAQGTSKTAVYNPAATPTGVPGGTGTVAAPPVQTRKEDKSRVPGLLGSVDWNDCPFPGEADAEQIDQAFVLIQVKVKPDGSPENVTVVQDPGHGFGREARKCAMRKKYSQGLDADGNAIGGMTKPFRVRFER